MVQSAHLGSGKHHVGLQEIASEVTEDPSPSGEQEKERKSWSEVATGPVESGAGFRGDQVRPGRVVGVRGEALKPKVRGLLGPVVPLDQIGLPNRPDLLLKRPIGSTVSVQSKNEDEPPREHRYLGSTFLGAAVISQKGRPKFVPSRYVQFPQGSEPMHPLSNVPPQHIRRPSAELKKVLTATLERAPQGHLPARRYADALFEQGHAVYMVGGAVRDAIQNLDDDSVSARDVDLATTALPKDVRRLAGEMQGQGGAAVASPDIVDTWGAVLLEGEQLDMVTLKVETDSKNVPKKSNAVFGPDVMKDAVNRDFTCNALYYDPVHDVVVDPTGHGVQDAATKTLRLTKPAEEANLSHVLRFFKFRMRGYQPAEGMLQDIQGIAARTFTTKKLAASVARVSPHGAKTPEAAEQWLQKLGQAMHQDGLGKYFDDFIAPNQDAIVNRIVYRNG